MNLARPPALVHNGCPEAFTVIDGNLCILRGEYGKNKWHDTKTGEVREPKQKPSSPDPSVEGQAARNQAQKENPTHEKAATLEDEPKLADKKGDNLTIHIRTNTVSGKIIKGGGNYGNIESRTG